MDHFKSGWHGPLSIVANCKMLEFGQSKGGDALLSGAAVVMSGASVPGVRSNDEGHNTSCNIANSCKSMKGDQKCRLKK